MDKSAYEKLVDMASAPEAMEASVNYLYEQFAFIKPNENVLICFTRKQPNEIGSLFEKAVLRRGAVPVFWENDFRWKTLLRQAFLNRVTTVIGPPMVVLGLSKIARFNATPLFVRNVVTAGYPSMKWMVEGIARGFDCNSFGCFTPGGRVIAGFTCKKTAGIHVRDDVYGVEIQNPDENGLGDMVIFDKTQPDLKYPVGEKARLISADNCGAAEHHLVDCQPGTASDLQLDAIQQNLINWTSVLDCRVRRSNQGLELELVVFPGEKLPKLPSAAKQIVRAWNPEKDEPFYYTPGIEKT